MNSAYLYPFKLIACLFLCVGLALSYASASIVIPILSAIERTKDGNGIPTPVFLILGIIASPILFCLWLESVPDTIRRAAEARHAADQSANA